MQFSGAFPLGVVAVRDLAAVERFDASREMREAVNAAAHAVPAARVAGPVDSNRLRTQALRGRTGTKGACLSRRHRKECRCHSAPWPPSDSKPSPQTKLGQAGLCRSGRGIIG